MIKVGSKVRTPGGIKGTVISVKDTDCHVRFTDFRGQMWFKTTSLKLQK